MKQASPFLFPCLFFVLTLTSCSGGGGTGGGGGNNPTITSVSVSCSPGSINMAQTSTCSATVAGTGNYSSTVTWTATGGSVTSAGVFTPTATGTASVTATSAEDTTKSGSGNVTVTAVPVTVTAVSVIAQPSSITTAQTSQCTATVTGTGAFTKAVTWTAKGGTIDSNGVFTPTAAGNASCTANSAQSGYTNISGSANITVTAVPITVTAINVIAQPSAINTDQTSQCTATVTGTGAFTTAVTWTAKGGTIDGNGVFTPTAAGNASCTANSAQSGYTNISGSATINVTLAPPVITNWIPRYTVLDNFSNAAVANTITCEGCLAGDILHDEIGFSDLVLPTAETTLNFGDVWNALDYEPRWDTSEIQHPGGPYGNQWSVAFFGNGSQSTLAVSPTTGTFFQVQQQTGDIYWLKADGTKGDLFPGASATTNIQIAVDDVSGKFVYAFTGDGPEVVVDDESGNLECYIIPAGVMFISSVAAKGGYVTFTDPNENIVGVASLTGCSGNVQISYTSISVVGQPWAVAMATNGSETDAYVISRDTWSTNSIPGLSKINVATGTVVGSVALTGFTPVSTVRATNPYEGLYQVQSYSLTQTAAVLSQYDNTVLIISTNTSSGNTMQITHTVTVPEIPFAIAAEEDTGSPLLWVPYILGADGNGEAVTHIGEINPTTGIYTPAVGECAAGVLAGGFTADSNGGHCAMVSTIYSPVVLQ